MLDGRSGKHNISVAMSSTPAMSAAELLSRFEALELRVYALEESTQTTRRWARPGNHEQRAGASCSCLAPAAPPLSSRSRSSGPLGAEGGAAATAAGPSPGRRPNLAQSPGSPPPQTVAPGPPPPPSENLPPRAAPPPPTPPPCTYHIQGSAANAQVTVSDYIQARTPRDLEKLFTHLGATLFRPDQQALYDLWYRTELEVVQNNRLEVY